MRSSAIFLAALVAAGVASPSGSDDARRRHRRLQPIRFDSAFDKYTPDALGIQPIGTHARLDWPGFFVGTEEIAGVQAFGVTPSSEPNVASANVLSGNFTGPSMQVNYTGSNTQAFNLHSFYYACIDVSETPVATAENCTITVTGYREENLIANQTFVYGGDQTLGGTLNATMTHGKFEATFHRLTTVDFTYSATNDVDATPGLLVDNVAYTALVYRK